MVWFLLVLGGNMVKLGSDPFALPLAVHAAVIDSWCWNVERPCFTYAGVASRFSSCDCTWCGLTARVLCVLPCSQGFYGWGFRDPYWLLGTWGSRAGGNGKTRWSLVIFCGRKVQISRGDAFIFVLLPMGLPAFDLRVVWLLTNCFSSCLPLPCSASLSSWSPSSLLSFAFLSCVSYIASFLPASFMPGDHHCYTLLHFSGWKVGMHGICKHVKICMLSSSPTQRKRHYAHCLAACISLTISGCSVWKEKSLL